MESSNWCYQPPVMADLSRMPSSEAASRSEKPEFAGNWRYRPSADLGDWQLSGTPIEGPAPRSMRSAKPHLGPGARSHKRPSPCRLKWVIDQRLHPLYEPDGAGQVSVNLECRLIRPARVDVEQPRIAGGAISLDRKAAWLLANTCGLLAQHRRGDGVITFSDMKAGENEQFHSGSAADFRNSKTRMTTPSLQANSILLGSGDDSRIATSRRRSRPAAIGQMDAW